MNSRLSVIGLYTIPNLFASLCPLIQLFVYTHRAHDALRAVTSVAIKEARIKEIKREMLASQTLKSFFKEHPKDEKVLKFDRALHIVKHKQHLADVPEYIVPETLQTVAKSSRRENKRLQVQAALSYEPKRKHKRRPAAKKNDPLKSFKIHKSQNKKRKTKTK